VTVAGPHTVVETDPPGYLSTTPNSVDRDISLGQGVRVDFGDVLAGACVCGPDAYEDDDVPDDATFLEPGSLHVQHHDFCDDAVDWVTFTVESRGVVTVTTSSWGQRADTVLSIYDRDGVTMLVGNDDDEHSTDYSSALVWQALSSGVYYVRVTNRGDAVGCYTGYDVAIESHEPTEIFLPLVLSEVELRDVAQVGEPVARDAAAAPPDTELGLTGVINHACPDAFETDDAWMEAAVIETGVSQVHSFDSDPAMYVPDKDIVWFDVEPFHVHSAIPITFTITHITNTEPLMTLYDALGSTMNVTGTTQLTWVPDAPGRYYLAVTPQTTTFGCVSEAGYQLVAQIPPVRWVYLPVVLQLVGP
jgi:hypothetical protein